MKKMIICTLLLVVFSITGLSSVAYGMEPQQEDKKRTAESAGSSTSVTVGPVSKTWWSSYLSRGKTGETPADKAISGVVRIARLACACACGALTAYTLTKYQKKNSDLVLSYAMPIVVAPTIALAGGAAATGGQVESLGALFTYALTYWSL